MSPKFFPSDVVSQSESIKNAWAQINATLTFGSLDLQSLAADIENTTILLSEIDKLETQLLNKANRRNELYATLWDTVKRVRAGVKAAYGDDSSEYEMVGGTRISERKSPRRTVSPAA